MPINMQILLKIIIKRYIAPSSMNLLINGWSRLTIFIQCQTHFSSSAPRGETRTRISKHISNGSAGSASTRDQAQIGGIITPPGAWTTWWAAFPKVKPLGLASSIFPGHSGHMVEITYSWDLFIRRIAWWTVRTSRISQLRTLLRSVTPCTLRKNPILLLCTTV